VKVIINHGRFTSCGPDKSAAERQLIGGIANPMARSENVGNQLEVSLRPASN